MCVESRNLKTALSILLSKPNINIRFISFIILIISIFLSISISAFSLDKYYKSSIKPVAKKSSIPYQNLSKNTDSYNGTIIVAMAKSTPNEAVKITEDDSVKKENRITKFVQRSDGYSLGYELDDMTQKITISAYNMLGKQVELFYEDFAERLGEEVYIPTSRLPNGVYLLVIQGENFRLPKKFIVSR